MYGYHTTNLQLLQSCVAEKRRCTRWLRYELPERLDPAAKRSALGYGHTVIARLREIVHGVIWAQDPAKLTSTRGRRGAGYHTGCEQKISGKRAYASRERRLSLAKGSFAYTEARKNSVHDVSREGMRPAPSTFLYIQKKKDNG